jgi:deazaflavin-dependent oxidoreductase (nitroreductase family)
LGLNGERKSNGVIRRLLHIPVHIYRWGFGWMLGRRFLLLTHIGRVTGRRHETVLEVMEYRAEGPELIVMSGFGRDAAWLRNIEATSFAEVTIGTERFPATHRFLGEEEAVGVVKSYEKHNRLIRPVLYWVLSRLLGWKNTGSDADHRRLVQQLPLIAFRKENRSIPAKISA